MLEEMERESERVRKRQRRKQTNKQANKIRIIRVNEIGLTLMNASGNLIEISGLASCCVVVYMCVCA